MTVTGGRPAKELGRLLWKARQDHGLRLVDMSARLNVGGSKGTFSDYENGNRLPPVHVLTAYATAFGLNARGLLALRTDALEERVRLLPSERASPDGQDEAPPGCTPEDVPQAPRAAGAPADVPASSTTCSVGPCVAAAGVTQRPATSSAPAGTPRPVSAGTGRFRRRLLAGVALAAVLAIGLVIAAATTGGSNPVPPPVVLFEQPTGTAPHKFPVKGRLSGWRSNDELWIASQSVGDQRFHPTETPCTVIGDRFLFPVLYLGRPEDAGKQFRLLAVVVRKGSSAQAAFERFAARPKDRPDSYDGLDRLPDGATVVADQLVTRS